MKARRRSWTAFYVLNWLVIGLFWFLGSGKMAISSGSVGAVLLSLGGLSGLAAAFTILTQIILMSRFPLLERVFGHDKLAILHHKNGRVALPLLLLHPLLIILGYSMLTGSAFLEQAVAIIREFTYVLPALIAVILFVVVVISSLYIVYKKLKYERWYTVHLLVYIAIFLSFGHQIELGTNINAHTLFYGYWIALYIVVFGLHILFRFVMPIVRAVRHRFVIHRVVEEARGVFSLYIRGEHLDTFPVAPGQFMILRFLQKGFWSEAHPFSLSKEKDGQYIRITIKGVGDFTQRVGELKVGTRVIIEGGYGIFTSRVSSRDKVLMIAGGIGITPIRSLAEELLKSGKEIVLLYGNRTERDIVFRDELLELERTYPKLNVVHILSEDGAYAGERGYVDKEKLERLVPDINEREVFMCGPVVMTESLAPLLDELGVQSGNVHFERFSLHTR